MIIGTTWQSLRSLPYAILAGVLLVRTDSVLAQLPQEPAPLADIRVSMLSPPQSKEWAVLLHGQTPVPAPRWRTIATPEQVDPAVSQPWGEYGLAAAPTGEGTTGGHLACIAHPPPAAAADPSAGTRRARSSRLDGASATPAPSSTPRAASQRRLDALATEGREECRLEIRLQQAYFDPLREHAPLVPALAVATRGSGERDYHLIQFDRPIRPEWRQSLLELGVDVLDYVPDLAYVVRADPLAIERASRLEPVRWIGAFAPAYRLANELTEPALSPRSGQTLELMVRGFAGEPVDDLLSQFDATGVQVRGYGEDSGGGALFDVVADEPTLLALATIRAVAWIEPKSALEFANAIARSNQLIGKDLVEQQLGYYGQGQIVAVTDSGLSTGNVNTVHQDFAGRVLGWSWGGGSCGHWADENHHGTHVAGSVLGSGQRSGSNPSANQYAGSQAGIAPKAGLVVWSTCEDFSGVPMTNGYAGYWTPLYGFNSALRVNNNSWGSTHPSTFGTYNTFARDADRFIRDFPDMVAVFAAHNQGRDGNGDGVSDFTTATPPSTAKNVIAVGASENLRSSGGFNPGGTCSTYGGCWGPTFPANPLAGDRLSDHANGMAAFSGRGPTLSNRLKPDIVAPGTNIVSARNESAGEGWGVANQFYLYSGGTSMASPLVAGGAAIVREYFLSRFGHNPSAALVKATLINAARDMTPGQYGTGATQDVWRRPDIHQGWGRMDLPNTLIFTGQRRPAYFEAVPGVQTGQLAQVPLEIGSGGSELRVTLVWTDVAGLEASHGALVNDLDLELVDPSSTVHFGFAGLVGQQRDRYNNFEEVRLASAPAGSYTIRVRGHNVPQGPQPFAVVVTGNVRADLIFRNGFE